MDSPSTNRSILEGHAYWICGLSGSGKSTQSRALATGVRHAGYPVLELDGDTLRQGLCRNLGFTEAERTENLRRAAEIVRLGLASGLCVVASFITPLKAHRRLVREIVGAENFSLVWTDAPLEVCRRRDVKGLYARARTREVLQMTGIDSRFEAPDDADLILPTGTVSQMESSRTLVRFALARLGRADPAAPASTRSNGDAIPGTNFH
jgi:adenylyl-sulfate kinase